MSSEQSLLSASRTFPSRLTEVSTLLGWLQAIQPPSLPEALWIQAQTAVVEGFTNAVRHAHGDLESPPPVLICVDCREGELVFRIHDGGAPFRMSAPEPTPDRTSQWGLILLQRLKERHGWSVSYDHLPQGGNVLLLRHSVSPG